MKITTQITLGSICTTALSVLLSLLMLGSLAASSSEQAIREQVEARLVALREVQQTQVESWFDSIRDQLQSLAINPTVVQSMLEISGSLRSFAASQEFAVENRSEELEAFYQDQLAMAYARQNAGNQLNTREILQGLALETQALQISYLLDNEHPLDQKHQLNTAGLGSHYDWLHGTLHPFMRDFAQRFGFTDIYLVDSRGLVSYSVRKQMDFATSLVDGPFADSGLGRAYRQVNELEADELSLVDFSAYRPNMDAPAAFMGIPVFNEDGRRLGALLIQMPIDPLNAIMTNDFQWEEAGLGQSGESYLVASDRRARSISRGFVEQPEVELQELQEQGVDIDLLEAMRSRQTNIALQSLSSEAVERALGGDIGIDLLKNSKGNTAFAAYAPLKVSGLSWVIVTELAKSEALAGVAALQQRLAQSALALALFIITVAGLIGLLGARRFVRPILQLAATLQQIGRDSDLTLRSEVKSRNEIGSMAGSLNSTLDTLQASLQQVSQESVTLVSTSHQLNTTTKEGQQLVHLQQQESAQIASATTQMQAVVHDMAKNTQQASQAAHQADQSSQEGKSVMQTSIASIQRIAEELQQASGLMVRVEQDSSRVNEVLDVIRSIADQTNLLALNAAIESARAGELGRGFAVVADEVRQLAGRTQESLDQVHGMVESLQQGVHQAVSAMENTRMQSVDTVRQAEAAGFCFDQIADAITAISSMNLQIASAAEEQSATTDEISRNLANLSQQAEQQ